MKIAWIAFVGTIIGALIGVFDSTHYKNWIEGPKEGFLSRVKFHF